MTINENEIAKLLKVCLEHIGYPPPGPIEIPFLSHRRGDRTLSLVDEGVFAYHRTVGQLLTQRQISDRYSEEAVHEKLDLVLLDLLELGQASLREATLRASVDKLLASFEEELPERRYFLGIANVHLEDRLELGPVTIRAFTEQEYQALLARMDSIIDGSQYYSEREKGSWKRHFTKFLKQWKGHALAETTSSVERRRGAELSRRFLEEALHVLRFLGGFVYTEKDAAWIGEVGEVQGGMRQILEVAEGEFSWYSSRTGPLRSFELTNEIRSRLESLGLLELQDILARDIAQRTELQKALLNAVVWISRAQSDDCTEGRFVKFCISMESILLDKGKYPKGETMARRLATLLSGCPEDRDQIISTGKDIYCIRNDIVHEGFSAQAKAYSPIARHYALQSTSRVLTQYEAHDWTTVEAVANWLDQ